MKLIFIISTLVVLACGCSQAITGVMPDIQRPPIGQSQLLQQPRWLWSANIYQVSADHQSIEKLPIRSQQLHLNVTPFVESPDCNQCIIIGKPLVQPDGTIKVNVMLTHPFPTKPEYTGFDVRGTIMFPATRYWKSPTTPVWTKDLYQVYDQAP